jgi:hypothetical protein
VPDFIFLMYNDGRPTAEDWEPYLNKVRASGAFEGGSSIGNGLCFRKDGTSRAITKNLGGYLRFTAKDLADAQRFLAGNPVFEAGGTVEIRELPRD